jgi:transketolase
VHGQVPEIAIGKSRILREGSVVSLLNAGNTLPLALEAAARLGSFGYSTEVVSFHTIKPLDVDYLRYAFSKFQLVATVE